MHAPRNAWGLIGRLVSCASLQSQTTGAGALRLLEGPSGLRVPFSFICRSFAAALEPAGEKAAGSTKGVDGVVPLSSAAGIHREGTNLQLPENGFWQAAEVLFQKRETPNLVGRWDWHAWQLLVALLPPLAIFGIAKYGQREMEEADEQQRKLAEDAAAAAARSAAAADGADAAAAATGPSADARRAMAQRLDAVEATVRALQAHLEAQPPAGTSSANEVGKAARAAGERVSGKVAGTATDGAPSAEARAPSVQPSSKSHSTGREHRAHP